jgi:hypothetical protein
LHEGLNHAEDVEQQQGLVPVASAAVKVTSGRGGFQDVLAECRIRSLSRLLPLGLVPTEVSHFLGTQVGCYGLLGRHGRRAASISDGVSTASKHDM